MSYSTSEYSFSDVEVRFLNRTIVGFQGVSYKVTQNKVNIYGKGSKPVARGTGNKEYEGTVKVLQSELEALQIAAGNGSDICDILPFDIVVTYETPTNTVTDTLKQCEFTEQAKELNQGDTHMEIELPISIGDIEFNS
ncbi:MAG: hypothetical protein Roseis2KO_27540 [Roseivirga sp.]